MATVKHQLSRTSEPLEHQQLAPALPERPTPTRQLDQEREKLLRTPLVDWDKASQLCPVTQIILADMEVDSLRKLLAQQSAIYATDRPGSEEVQALAVQKARDQLASMVQIASDARPLPTAAFYSSARTKPFFNNTRCVEAVGLLVDHLINQAAPAFSPEGAPGVSISNGGGTTGGMKCVNDATLLALGDPLGQSFRARAIQIPLEIRAHRDQPYDRPHPAAWQTPSINGLGPRTLAIIGIGNQNPLQRNSCAVTLPCGAGGLEEACREISEVAAGRTANFIGSVPNGKRFIHVIGENFFFLPFQNFLATQERIGAFQPELCRRVRFWDLSAHGVTPLQIADALIHTFEQKRETPRVIYMSRKEEQDFGAALREKLSESATRSPRITPLFDSPLSGRHPTEVAADTLYRKVLELTAIQEGIRELRVSEKRSIDQIAAGARDYYLAHADDLLNLMRALGNRPTITIMGHSRGVELHSVRGEGLLTEELKIIGKQVIWECVRLGISIVLTSDGDDGVNAFVENAYHEAQRRRGNINSLLVRSAIEERRSARSGGLEPTRYDHQEGGYVIHTTPALQSLWGGTLVKNTLGTPIGNLVLGPIAASELGGLAQTVTDRQLAEITRSTLNGLPLPPETFVVSGHYEGARRGNYWGLEHQYRTMVERGTMDQKDLVGHQFMASTNPAKTARAIIEHLALHAEMIAR